MGLLQTVLSFLVAIFILVTIHEFGHFWVARRCGVKVLRFSIGFGKPLFSRRGKDGVEYVLAAIPLGGYVQMLDESEGDVPPAERDRAFNAKPLRSRLAIVLAGPAANLIFAVFAYWLAFVVGIEGLRPVVGEVAPQSVAASADLRQGDRIVRVDGQPVSTWERVFQRVARASLDGDRVALDVENEATGPRTARLDMAGISLDDIGEGGMFDVLGFQRALPRLSAVLSEVVPGSAAERGGLQAGDRIVSIDGEPIDDWAGLIRVVSESAGEPLVLGVDRDGAPLRLFLTPAEVQRGNTTVGQIGAVRQQDPEELAAWRAVEQYGALEAVGQAFTKTVDNVTLILTAAWKMLTLQLSPKNISGPVQIAEFAGLHASAGLAYFATFLAFVSVSLGVLNLLPVPMLDGGHVLYYAIEALRGRPLSLDAQVVGQKIGLALLVGLMGIAFYNDFARLAQVFG